MKRKYVFLIILVAFFYSCERENDPNKIFIKNKLHIDLYCYIINFDDSLCVDYHEIDSKKDIKASTYLGARWEQYMNKARKELDIYLIDKHLYKQYFDSIRQYIIPLKPKVDTSMYVDHSKYEIDEEARKQTLKTILRKKLYYKEYHLSRKELDAMDWTIVIE